MTRLASLALLLACSLPAWGQGLILGAPAQGVASGGGSGDLTAITVTGDGLTLTDGTGPVPDLAVAADLEELVDHWSLDASGNATAPSLLATSHLTLLSADTNGARLEVNSGILDAREGDDSALIGVRALRMLVVEGSATAGIGATDNGAGGSALMAFDGTSPLMLRVLGSSAGGLSFYGTDRHDDQYTSDQESELSMYVNGTEEVTITSSGVDLRTALAETEGGTGQTTYAQGDLLYSDAANSLAKLALGGTVGEILHQASATAPGYSDASIAAVDSQGLSAKTFLATIAAAGDATLDPGDAGLQTLTLSGNTTFDTTLTGFASGKGRAMQLRVTCDGSERTLTFPSDWKWMGSKPATLAANAQAVLSLTSWGPDEDDVVAVWTVLGDGS